MTEKEQAAQQTSLKAKQEELAIRERALAQREQEFARKGAKERLYDKIKVPVKLLDAIIALSVIAIIACFILGSR